jgi:hypothetical protein
MRNERGTGKIIDGDAEERATGEMVSQMIAQQAAPGILLNGMTVMGTEVVQGERFSIFLVGENGCVRLDIKSEFQLVDLSDVDPEVYIHPRYHAKTDHPDVDSTAESKKDLPESKELPPWR